MNSDPFLRLHIEAIVCYGTIFPQTLIKSIEAAFDMIPVLIPHP